MIRVNGRNEIEWRESLTVADVMEMMHYTYPHIFVRVNDKLVPEADYARHKIPDGADVKVIHLMAGG